MPPVWTADPPVSDPFGLTLAQYAAAVGKHPQSQRPRYSALLRQTPRELLPPVTRMHEEHGTIKFCLPLPRPPLETESVIIPMVSYRARSWYTLCVSSQIGCRMACTFCQTASLGLHANLSASEIVQQRLVARALLLSRRPADPPARPGPRPGRSHPYFADGIQNIVFMGMGEPFDNYENLIQAIRVLNEPAGLDFPHTQITVSTVGRVDGLRKLATLGWINLRLAISLNAAQDALRDRLMPINKSTPLKELQKALLEYPHAKKARYLIEYVLIKGVNDSPADADAVAAWCKPLPCIVNLIPYNPQVDARFGTPRDETIAAFLFRLKAHGIFTKRRITYGQSLLAACGQLGNGPGPAAWGGFHTIVAENITTEAQRHGERTEERERRTGGGAAGA